MSGTKRRLSTTEKESDQSGNVRESPCEKDNASKSQKTQGSPKEGSVTENKILELVKHVKEKQFDKASKVVSVLAEKRLSPSQTETVELAEYLVNQSKGVRSRDILNSAIDNNPVGYAARFLRWNLEDRINRLVRSEDGLVLDALAKRYPEELPAFTFVSFKADIMDEERAIYFNELQKKFPIGPSSSKKSILESMDDLFGMSFTHPLSYIRNFPAIDLFQQKNEHINTPAECSTAEPKKKVSAKTVAGTSKEKIKTRSMVAKEQALERENRKIELQEEGYERDPWDGVPDVCVVSKNAADNKIMNEMSEAIVRSRLIREQQFLPGLNFKRIHNMKIHLDSFIDYGKVFREHKQFFKILAMVDSSIKGSQDTDEIIKYCVYLESSVEPYFRYFADYLLTSVYLASGDLVKAKITIDAALLRHEYPKAGKDKQEHYLQLTLVNSLVLLKALIELTIREYDKCIDCIKLVLEKDCCNPDAHNLFVKVLLEENNINEAMKYMTDSNYVKSMHFDPVKAIFNLMSVYYKTRNNPDVDAGAMLASCGSFSTVIALKALGQIPVEMLIWMTATTLNMLSGNNRKDYADIEGFFRDLTIDKKAKGSTGQMLKRVIKKINLYYQEEGNRPKYFDLVSGIKRGPAAKTLSKRKDDITRFMQSNEWNYFIMRFLHSYVVDDWLTVSSEIIKEQIESVPATPN